MSVKDDAEGAVKDIFAKVNDKRLSSQPRQPPSITSQETSLQSNTGFIPTPVSTVPGDDSGGGGTLDVASYDETSATYPEEVDNVSRISFEMTDPDEIDHLTVLDNGGGEAMVQLPTTTITGAVSGVPSTLVIVTDGTNWDAI